MRLSALAKSTFERLSSGRLHAFELGHAHGRPHIRGGRRWLVSKLRVDVRHRVLIEGPSSGVQVLEFAIYAALTLKRVLGPAIYLEGLEAFLLRFSLVALQDKFSILAVTRWRQSGVFGCFIDMLGLQPVIEGGFPVLLNGENILFVLHRSMMFDSILSLVGIHGVQVPPGRLALGSQSGRRLDRHHLRLL